MHIIVLLKPSSGKHVWSEKMIAVNLEEGEELVALANEKIASGVAPDTFWGRASRLQNMLLMLFAD